MDSLRTHLYTYSVFSETSHLHSSMEREFNEDLHKKDDDDSLSNSPAKYCPRRETHIGSYRVLKTIGKGNFAKVKLAKHMPSGKKVAIKIIDKNKLDAINLRKLFREVKIMKMLDHPNIVKLYQVIETEWRLYVVMEYVSGGELFEYLVANGRVHEEDARIIFRQIVSAVQYCHQKRIVHRDLKAENLLLDEDMNIKIVDFGFSNEFCIGRKLDTFCGSPPYAAPELFLGKEYNGPEVDVWSLGVVLYALVTGMLPFDGSNLKKLRERVLRCKFKIPFYMSLDCENLIKKFLVLNPTKRPSLRKIMKDKWINFGEEDELKPYIESQFNFNDETRIEVLLEMGYELKEIEDSLLNRKYDDLMANYLLMENKEDEKFNSLSISTQSLSGSKQILQISPNAQSSTKNKFKSHDDAKSGVGSSRKSSNITGFSVSNKTILSVTSSTTEESPSVASDCLNYQSFAQQSSDSQIDGLKNSSSTSFKNFIANVVGQFGQFRRSSVQSKRSKGLWNRLGMRSVKNECNLNFVGRDKSVKENILSDLSVTNPAAVPLTVELCDQVVEKLNLLATYTKKIYYRSEADGNTMLCKILVDGICIAYIILSTVTSPSDALDLPSEDFSEAKNAENVVQTVKLLQQYSDQVLDLL